MEAPFFQVLPPLEEGPIEETEGHVENTNSPTEVTDAPWPWIGIGYPSKVDFF